MHPLTPNLHDMNDTDLNERIKSLNTKLVQAYRSSPGVVNQIRMMLDDFIEERTNRDKEQLKKLLDQSKDKGNDWDDIIDIG
jgi:hypothetical protein